MDNLMKAKRILRANGIRYYADKHATKRGIHVSVKPGYGYFDKHPKRDAIALFLSGLADKVSRPIYHGECGHYRCTHKTGTSLLGAVYCEGVTRYIFHV